MLFVESALEAYAVEGSDGSIGTVSDCLFDDRTWKLRWLVVDTRSWLTGRKVLIHPSAFGRLDLDNVRVPVHLTKALIKASPNIASDQPVSAAMEQGIYGYYGWDPEWGGGGYFAGYPQQPFGEAKLLDRPAAGNGEPNLRSMAELKGYHVEASDGAMGHIDSFLIDDATWDVRYLIVDTRNWWFGAHVLVSPFAVTQIDWADGHVILNVSMDQVKKSPPWKPHEQIDKAYQQRLHGYYGWPGYGW